MEIFPVLNIKAITNFQKIKNKPSHRWRHKLQTVCFNFKSLEEKH